MLDFQKDLRKAYRFQKMCPGSINLLGFCVNNELYFDVALSMGSRSAAFCCQRTTNMITYIYKLEGFEQINYLDDLGSAEIKELAWIAYQVMGEILEKIGIEESLPKAQPPSVIAVFLGVLFNTVEMTMSITKERVKEMQELISQWLMKKSATLNEIQKLLGKLNFICNTVRAGRIFVSRLINEMKTFSSNGRRRLKTELKKDLLWWKEYMLDFDGISIIPDFDWSSPDKEMSTDSCLTGCGGWQSGKYFHCKFPRKFTNQQDISINELETLAVIIGLRKWAASLRNKSILAYCDNSATVEIVNSGKARNRFAQSCLREICYICAKNNMVIKLIHKKGVDNRICDFLSKWHLDASFEQKFLDATEGWERQEIEVTEVDFEFSHHW